MNENIRITLEETTKTWGIECDRYEILKLEPPKSVRASMQLQAEAERTRRKDIILSEANRISDINIAEGSKQKEILVAEAEAEAIEIKARSEKEGLALIAKTVSNGSLRGLRSLDYVLKRRYFEVYGSILKNGNITMLPESAGGQSNNSDVLAAVALMMQGRGHPLAASPHRSLSAEQRAAETLDLQHGTAERKELVDSELLRKVQFFSDERLQR